MKNYIDRPLGFNITVPAPALFAVMLVTFVFTGLNIYRLQPVLSSAMNYLSVDEEQVGTLMSVITLVSLILTIPTGLLLMRLDHRTVLVLSMFAQLLGLVAVQISTTYFGILVSQIFLGVANTLIMVCIPSFMQTIYGVKEFTARIGYANACQNIGMAVAFVLIPTLVASGSLAKPWTAFIVPTVAVLIVWVFIRFCKVEQTANSATIGLQENEAENTASSVSPLKDKKVWMKNAILKGLNKFQIVSYDVIEVLAAIFLAMTMLVTTTGVIFRYFLNNALPWTEEVCCIMLVYLAYLTAGLATVSKSHVVADFISQKIKGVAKIALSWFIRVLELVFLVVILKAMITLFPTIRIITSALEISRKIFYVPMIVMTGYMIFAILLDMLNELFPGYNYWRERQDTRDKMAADEEQKLQQESLASVNQFMDEVEGEQK